MTIEATTDRGTGLILPIAKAMAHLVSLNNELSREEPINNQQVAAEIMESGEHFSDATVREELVSEAFRESYEAWKTRVQTLTQRATESAYDQNLEEIKAELKAEIKEACIESWSILTQLDREVTGLINEQTDPGRQP